MGTVLDAPVAADGLVGLCRGKHQIAEIVRRLVGDLPVLESGVESLRVPVDTDQGTEMIVPRLGANTSGQMPDLGATMVGDSAEMVFEPHGYYSSLHLVEA